ASTGGSWKASTSPKHTAGSSRSWQTRAISTAFGCLPTRAKSPGVSVRPSPNMMMPRATGSPMVVNADPMVATLSGRERSGQQQRLQLGGRADGGDRVLALLGRTVAPLDVDRRDAVRRRALHVVEAVADHHRVAEVGLDHGEAGDRLGDDILLGAADLIDRGAGDHPEVLGDVAVVEDERGGELGLRGGERDRDAGLVDPAQ